MTDTEKKREFRPRQSTAWVESSFTTESTSSSKKRRLDTPADDVAKPKAKPKPPTWVTSEFAVSHVSPSKPLATQHAPPRPRDRSISHTAGGTTLNSFISTNATPNPKVKKQTLPTSFATQPAPIFAIPKTPQTDPQTRTEDIKASAIQVPAFRTSNTPRTTPFALGALKDAVPLPPPRIESKPSGLTPGLALQDDKDLIPLTSLITPRLFGVTPTASGKGKARVDEIPISDDPFIDQPSARPGISVEDVESDAEVFTMRELARGLDVSPSKKGRTSTSARQEPNKFVKGGLAARALVLITQREKDDALWHHHKTSKLANNPNLGEDLRVNVVERLQSIGESVLARCVVCPADATRLRATLVGDENRSSDLEEPSLVNVLLSRPGSRAIAGVEPGVTVRLWKPWIKLNLDAAARALPPALDGEHLD
ncbi:hypothetical protein FRC07_009341, partial [Ceratobasidium sp. 392]